MKLWFFGIIPWTRQTVTPASQLKSEALETVFVNRNRRQTQPLLSVVAELELDGVGVQVALSGEVVVLVFSDEMGG